MTSDWKNLNVFLNEWMDEAISFKVSKVRNYLPWKASERFELSLELILSLDSCFQELGSITPAELAQENKHNEIAKIIMESAKQDNVDLPCPPIHSDVMIKSDYQPDLLKGIPFWKRSLQTGPAMMLQQEVPRKWGFLEKWT